MALRSAVKPESSFLSVRERGRIGPDPFGISAVLAISSKSSGKQLTISFDDGNCLDMETIFGRLKDIGFDGPIILEILENTPEKIIESSVNARNMICEIMGR